MATKKQTPTSTSHQADANDSSATTQATGEKTSASKEKVIRKVSNKRYAIIESDFDKIFKKCEKLEVEIALLETNLREKLKVVPSGKPGETVTAPIKAIELPRYRKLLAEKKADLKFARKEMANKGRVFGIASSKNAQSARLKVKRFNERSRLSRAGMKHFEEIKEVVSQIISTLKENNDPRLTSLVVLALNDGRKFYSEFQKLLRAEVKSVNYKGMIAASSPLRTELSNMIRTSFGWSKDNK